MSKHMEPGRRALVKNFFANLGERKDLTCYVRVRWIPFRERYISQILGLKQVGECAEYEQLQKSPSFLIDRPRTQERSRAVAKDQDHLQRLN